MVDFKDWEEMWWFMKNYCNYSCFNCYYGGYCGEPSRHIFCRRDVAMIDLNRLTICIEWKSKDGESLNDCDAPRFRLSDETIDKLENGELSVSDLREMS